MPWVNCFELISTTIDIVFWNFVPFLPTEPVQLGQLVRLTCSNTSSQLFLGLNFLADGFQMWFQRRSKLFFPHHDASSSSAKYLPKREASDTLARFQTTGHKKIKLSAPECPCYVAHGMTASSPLSGFPGHFRTGLISLWIMRLFTAFSSVCCTIRWLDFGSCA